MHVSLWNSAGDSYGLPSVAPYSVYLLGATEAPENVIWALKTAELFGGLVMSANSVLVAYPEPWMFPERCPCGAPLTVLVDACPRCGASIFRIFHDTKPTEVLEFVTGAYRKWGGQVGIQFVPHEDLIYVFAWHDAPVITAQDFRRETGLTHAGALRVIREIWEGHENGHKFPIPPTILYRALYRKQWPNKPPFVQRYRSS